jgi:hypothetical protein
MRMDRPTSSGSNPADMPRAPRRRILQSGLAAAPVLLTLVSRPVLGGVRCQTCSAYGSLAGSVAAKQFATCSGVSPATWVSLSTWPTPYRPTGQNATPYHCPTTGLQGDTFSGRTLRQVMNFSDDGGTRTLARYIGAALLNATSGRTPTLTETTVRQMWNDLRSNGTFKPSAGIHWGAAEIVAYIKTTIG